MRLTVKWYTRDQAKIARIRTKFDIPDYRTINGWSPAEIAEHDMPVLRECERLGLLAILPHTWKRCGKHFNFDKRVFIAK